MTSAMHSRDRTACPRPARDLRIIGQGLTVPLVTGSVRRYANLDHAASAPCLVAVKEAVDALLPWYSSVHRGAGFPSRVATAAYDGARDAVLAFVRARPDDAVVFTKHTTEAINVLASALPDDAGVVVFAAEDVDDAFFAGAADFEAVDFAGADFLAATPVTAAAAARTPGGLGIVAAVSLGSFFAPEMTSLSSLPAENFGTDFFLDFIRSPVCGLRTQRALRTAFSNEPKPVIATFSPLATSRVIVSSTDSSAWDACLRFPS